MSLASAQGLAYLTSGKLLLNECMTLSVAVHFSWVNAKSLQLPTSSCDPPLPLWPHLLILLPSFTLSGHAASSFLNPFLKWSFSNIHVSNSVTPFQPWLRYFSRSILWQFPSSCTGSPLLCSALAFLHSPYHSWANYLIYLLGRFIIQLSTLVLLTDVPSAWNRVWYLVSTHTACWQMAWLNEFECGVWHTWVSSFHLTCNGDFSGLLEFSMAPSWC